MRQFKVTVNGSAYDVTVEEVAGRGARPSRSAAPPAPSAGVAGAVKINAPMPGSILEVRVAIGQGVAKGDPLLILEALEMESEIVAPRDGVVAGIHVGKGDRVKTGAPLISLN